MINTLENVCMVHHFCLVVQPYNSSMARKISAALSSGGMMAVTLVGVASIPLFDLHYLTLNHTHIRQVLSPGISWVMVQLNN